MRLVIHRGTHEIGGTCIEIVTASTRLVIDLGLPLVDGNREPVDSRRQLAKPLQQLKEEKIIPAIAGLFDDEHPAPDGILISHAHLDHVGLLPFTCESVPIFATRGTSKMMLAASIFAGQRSLARDRFREMKSGKPFCIGDCQITPLSVDHSIFGSVAILVEAEEKTILYSGDFRQHGRKPGMMKSLLEFLKTKNRVDLLLVEGTHFGNLERQAGITEYELEEEVFAKIQSAPALVLACFSALDLDRLITLYKATRRANRIFVVDPYTAFVLYLLGNQTQIPKPTREFGIRVYFNRFFEDRGLTRIRELFQSNRIELAELLATPKQFTMVFRTSMTKADFEGTLPPQSRCLYGYWQGYLKKPDWIELQAHLASVGGDFLPLHVSGHGYIDDVLKFIDNVNACKVIPVHTFEPKRFCEHFSNVLLLSDGESYPLK